MGPISFQRVSTFTEKCLIADTPGDITTALTSLLRDAGIHSWYVGPLVHESQLNPGTGYFGMPEGWQHRYAEAHYCDVDPVFLHAKKRGRPTTWGTCRERAIYGGASRRQLKVFQEAEDFDLNDGFIMPTLGNGRTVGGVTFGGDRPDLSPEGLLSLQLIGTYAYEGLRRFAEGFKRVPPTLTPRELEVLRWSAEGKTAWEIGEILAIGERTVRTHQEHVKGKYCVSSMVQAAVRAAVDGTITLP
jgi:LuxR family quorum sensing-dependent transcriptional regulator